MWHINKQFWRISIMKTLNGDKLIKHVQSKQTEYQRRREVVASSGDIQSTIDYKIRLMVLDNLLIRIMRGDFDINGSTKPQERDAIDELIDPINGNDGEKP